MTFRSSRREFIRTAAATGLSAVAAEAFSATPPKPEPDMHQAAAQLLAALVPDLFKKAQYPFNSEERLNWFYVPTARKGVPFKEMNDAQQKAAMELLKVGLSQKGIERTQTIRQLENVLKVMEQGKGPLRDPDNYFFTVFGEPAEKGAWGWRYEGHHCSLNFTVIDGQAVATTPQFFGANPAEVRDGPMKGTRTLAAEEDLGRALVKALDTDQRKLAVVSDAAPDDILTTNQRQAGIQQDTGVPYSALTSDQQGMLLSLIQQYASLQAKRTAKRRLDAIRKAGLDKIKFAWMGGLEKGERHYYRVQGSTFLIEYDNTQNNANHIHAVWRDFKGDWGADLLANHYRTADSHHGHDHIHAHVR